MGNSLKSAQFLIESRLRDAARGDADALLRSGHRLFERRRRSRHRPDRGAQMVQPGGDVRQRASAAGMPRRNRRGHDRARDHRGAEARRARGSARRSAGRRNLRSPAQAGGQLRRQLCLLRRRAFFAAASAPPSSPQPSSAPPSWRPSSCPWPAPPPPRASISCAASSSVSASLLDRLGQRRVGRAVGDVGAVAALHQLDLAPRCRMRARAP